MNRVTIIVILGLECSLNNKSEIRLTLLNLPNILACIRFSFANLEKLSLNSRDSLISFLKTQFFNVSDS